MHVDNIVIPSFTDIISCLSSINWMVSISSSARYWFLSYSIDQKLTLWPAGGFGHPDIRTSGHNLLRTRRAIEHLNNKNDDNNQDGKGRYCRSYPLYSAISK